MVVAVGSVRTGRTSHYELVDQILELQGPNPLAPVTVVVPTARSAIHLRREASRIAAERTGRGGLANVVFVVVRRLCDEIAGPGLRRAGRRPLSRIALEAACRTVLGAHRAAGGTVGRTPAGVSELADRYEELRGAETASIERLARRPGLAGELATLVTSVRSCLAPTHYDDVDLFDETVRLCATGSAQIGPTIVFAPERILPALGRVIEALLATGDVVALYAETGDEIADARPGEMNGLPVAGPSIGGRFTSIVRAPSAPGEARAAARVLLDRLDAGVHSESLAVVYPRRQPYAELLAFELDRAKIPWSGPSSTSLLDSASAQALVALCGAAGDEVHRADLVRLVGATAARPGSPAERSPGTFDRVTRRIGLAAAPFGEWIERMVTDFSDRGSERPTGVDVVAGSVDGGAELTAPSGRWRKDAGDARAFGRTLLGLSRHVEAIAGARTWCDAAEASRTALNELLGPEEERCSWPERVGEAERLVLSVLDEIATLDAIERFEGIGGFAAAVENALEREGPQVGRLGTGVVVGPLEHAQGLALDTIVVVGCTEGDLPARAAPSPLLSIADRDATGLESRSGAATAVRDRRRLLVAIAGAATAIATMPCADARSGRERIASRFLEGGPAPTEIDRIGSTWSSRSGDVRLHDRAAASRHDLLPSDLLLSLLAGTGARGEVCSWIDDLVDGLGRARSRSRSRGTDPCGPFDGVAPGLAAFDAIAPTTIETVAICPFRFFATHLLRIETVEEPERRLSISPADRGLAVHAILERYVRRRMSGTLPDDDGGRAAVLESIAKTVFRELERFGRTGKALLWEIERRHILRNLETERRRDEAAIATSGAASIAVEHTFGSADRPGPTVNVLDRPIVFRGTVDRIDRRGDGTLEVIDYKSGSARSYRRRGDDPVGRGRHLQLPVYALAARESFGADAVRATYRFVGTDTDEIEFRLDRDGMARFEHSLEVLVRAIDGGRYPYRPTDGDEDHCRGCEYDALCPADRVERWERVRQSADAAEYVAFVEPVVADEADLDPA